MAESSKPKEVRKCTVVLDNVPRIKQDLQHVHPLVQNLFLQEDSSGLPIAGRLKHFQKKWEKLFYQILFLSQLKQMKPPSPTYLRKKEESLVGLEIQAILRKRVMQMVEDSQYQVLSLTFLVEKKDSRCKTFVMFISDWKFSHFKGDSSDQIFYANYT